MPIFRTRNSHTSPSGRSALGFRNLRTGGTLILAIILALFSYIRYYSTQSINPYTGQKQHVGISSEQEIALGLNSAPAMMDQHGGLHPDQKGQDHVKSVGKRLVSKSFAAQAPYPFEFHLLADEQVINAFALPGGPVFITAALYRKLHSEDQLAGVLGHEIGHVIARHGGERITQNELFQGLSGAATVATGDYTTGQGVAALLNQFFSMPYGRDQELQSDELGVRIMLEAGYDPEALIGVMEILKAASGPDRIPERMSTHPDPENRIGKIREAILKYKSPPGPGESSQ